MGKSKKQKGADKSSGKKDRNKDGLQGSSKISMSKEDESRLLNFLVVLDKQEKDLARFVAAVGETEGMEDSDSADGSDGGSDSDSDSEGYVEGSQDSDDGVASSESPIKARPVTVSPDERERQEELFKRKLIRSDRLQSRQDEDRIHAEKAMAKLAVRSSVMSNSASQSSAVGSPSGGRAPAPNEKPKPASGGSIRVQLSCCADDSTSKKKRAELAVAKLAVLDRNMPPEDLVVLMQKKFGLTGAANAVKYSSLRVVNGGAFLSLLVLEDNAHIQLYCDPRATKKSRGRPGSGEVASVATGGNDVLKQQDQSQGPDTPSAPVMSVTAPVEPELTSPTEPDVASVVEDDEEDHCPTKADDDMQAGLQKLVSTPAYQKILKERTALPIFNAKETILEALSTNQVVVVSGETGSGKTTQLPTYILDDAIERGRGTQTYIVCTQPRRIAAVTVAERVAFERCEQTAGDTVGYQIRLQNVSGPATRILHCTTGVLLRKLQDPLFLRRVSHVVLDEVHERHIETDFLLALLRDECRRRPRLRLVLMSATLQEHSFAAYFGGCPVAYVSGRTHPVTSHYLQDAASALGLQAARGSGGYEADMAVYDDISDARDGASVGGSSLSHAAFQKAKRAAAVQKRCESDVSPPISNCTDLVADVVAGIIRKFSTGTGSGAAAQGQTHGFGDCILVFLSGLEAIDRVSKALRQKYGAQLRGQWNAQVCVLHGSQSAAQQRLAFRLTKPGEWKVVLATNIAETSVTVPDVTHVVDSGLVKEMRYDPACNLSSLRETVVSRASAKQRAGRAGRVRPGHCWRLYSQSFHDGTVGGQTMSMAPFGVPEIQRISLEEVVLQILLLQLGHPVRFLRSCLEPPSDAQLSAAVASLIDFGAVLPVADSLPLTPLGRHLARLPVDMHIGKMLLVSCLLKCTPAVLTVAAALCSSSKTGGPFVYPTHARGEAHEARRRFSGRGSPGALQLVGGEYSDLIAIVNAYSAWDAISCPASSDGKTSAASKADTSGAGAGKAALRPCKFFQSPGGCRSGASCRFPHVGGGGAANGDKSVPMSPAEVYAAKRQFCIDNFLNPAVLEEMRLLRQYFRRHLESAGFLHRASSAGGNAETEMVVEVCDNERGEADGAEIEGKGEAVYGPTRVGGAGDGASVATAAGGSAAVPNPSFTSIHQEAKVDSALLSCVLGAGLYPNIVRVVRQESRSRARGPVSSSIVVLDREAVHTHIHPTSLLQGQLNKMLQDPNIHSKAKETECLLAYHQRVATSQIYIRSCSHVPLLGVILLCGRVKLAKSRTALVVGSWIKCRLANELHGILYKSLQRAIERLFLCKAQDPTLDISQQQDQIIHIIRELLK